MRWRKIPVEIEAVEILDARTQHDQMFSDKPGWLMTALVNNDVVMYKPDSTESFAVRIKTLEGTMTGQPGDFIIQGVQGELYPCKPDIFAATYEPVEGE